MANKMLIDATHPEETRVVVVRENRVEEFDYESASKKQLRGNIYLAKVTRVEPSLQAAFVNYGGNRHGFLPFNEIHPDYYHLPLAERQALKQEEQRASRAAQARGRMEGRHKHAPAPDSGAPGEADADSDDDGENGAIAEAVENAAETPAAESASEVDSTEAGIALEAALPPTRYSGDLYAPSADGAGDDDDASDNRDYAEAAGDAEFADESDDDSGYDDDDDDDGEDMVEVINDDGSAPPVQARERGERGKREEVAEVGSVESVGSEDALEELPDRIRRRRRNYKIQEVIKRGQILLVQVVKEERGNKGAALTTYLSLAGRYTVLMPNTGSGGGISRKISSPADRKRLREIAGELDVSDGMGLIVRTAGASRTKSEIKRDYEYLLRLWENVREMTLKSSAPCLVYEEGDLIKRSIRDLYNRDIDEVLVAGDDAYKDAKDFMRMLMPSHAKNVQLYRDPEPVFIRYEVERQLNAMFSPQVTLPSGGYIVLNQTEALVAIDVNSGKSTREFSIEDTALKTNLEAAEEIARQLRLRDLAGLIVVDFIDMEEKRNNRAVERKLKECLRNDRARIQVGRISHFGLLEMSRQRLRTGMIEGSTCSCPTCQGTGFVRSTESVALSVLRGLEDWLRTNQPANLNALTSTEVALYILNQKRGYLNDIERRYGVTLGISASDRVFGGSFHIEKISPAIPPQQSTGVSMAVTQMEWRDDPADEEAVEADSGDASSGAEGEDDRRSRRRRRRRRGGRGEGAAESHDTMNGAAVAFGSDDESASQDGGETGEPAEQRQDSGQEDDEDGSQRRRSRRRGRRGGRHQRARQLREGGEQTAAEEAGDTAGMAAAEGEAEQHPAIAEQQPAIAESHPAEAEPEQPPVMAMAEEQPLPFQAAEPVQETREPEMKERRGHLNGNGAAHVEATSGENAVPAEEDTQPKAHETAAAAEPKPRGNRRGWWQRR